MFSFFFLFFSPSSRDKLWPATERLIPPPAAGAHGRVPAHEDAQEDPGTPLVRVLCDIRQDGTTHLHCKKLRRVRCVCVLTSGIVPLLRTAWDLFQCIQSLF